MVAEPAGLELSERGLAPTPELTRDGQQPRAWVAGVFMVRRFGVHFAFEERGRDSARLFGTRALGGLDDLFRHDVDIVHLADRVLQMAEAFDEGLTTFDSGRNRLQQVP
jgi:hypothetical protein